MGIVTRPALVFLVIIIFSPRVFAVGDPRAMKANRARASQQGSPQQAQSQTAQGPLSIMFKRKPLQYMEIDKLQVIPNIASQDQANAPQLKDALDKNAVIWNSIANPEVKDSMVRRYIADYRASGISINKNPSHYTAIIDEMSKRNPEMLSRPFNKVLETVAIIEYDFDNGVNKDEMAKKILGEQGFINNKKRLGME